MTHKNDLFKEDICLISLKFSNDSLEVERVLFNPNKTKEVLDRRYL